MANDPLPDEEMNGCGVSVMDAKYWPTGPATVPATVPCHFLIVYC